MIGWTLLNKTKRPESQMYDLNFPGIAISKQAWKLFGFMQPFELWHTAGTWTDRQSNPSLCLKQRSLKRITVHYEVNINSRTKLIHFSTPMIVKFIGSISMKFLIVYWYLYCWIFCNHLYIFWNVLSFCWNFKESCKKRKTIVESNNVLNLSIDYSKGCPQKCCA